MRRSKTCAYVLAAGRSARMGACKLLAPFAGRTLLDRALDAACGCRADAVAVVTGAYADEVAPVLAARGVEELRNDVWASGQSSSVAAAAAHARERGFDAALLMVADQPFARASHLDALLDAYEKTGARAVVAAANGRRGNPCLFDRACFPALEALEGDEGARALLRREPGLPVEAVRFDDALLFEDVDTPEDLARLEEMMPHA